MAKKSSGWWKWLLVAALGGAGVYFGRALWLRGLGEFLVRAEAPQKAEVAVVLAGDGYGRRIQRAVELARQGWVRQVLVSGPQGVYDTNEAELAIAFAVRRGAPREMFVAVPMRARSTIAEAGAIDAALQNRGARRALVVTSNYHTRRARAIFDRFTSGRTQYTMVAAPDEEFTPHDWWRTRDGRKVVFLEYAKLFHWWLLD